MQLACKVSFVVISILAIFATMPAKDPAILNLLACIELEEKEQVKRYSLDQQHTLKSLKNEGLALHPISITRKNFGYADYPEISFRLNFPTETNLFKDGSAIECFIQGEEPIKGVLMNLDGKSGEFRLFAPDFPDWLEDAGVGIKLAPDQRTTALMETALNNLENNKELFALFQKIHEPAQQDDSHTTLDIPLAFDQSNLNESQQLAVRAIVLNPQITLLHGPPGTGKTTTLAEAILQLVRAGEKVLVSAPSNTAVDNIAKALLQKKLKILRVGNLSKVDEALFAHTPEGRLANSKQQKEIKQLKIRAEEFRKMALKYKRSFGKAEREQRNLLLREVKNTRTEIKKLQAYNEEKLFAEAEVVLGTPVGLYDARMQKIKFQTLVMDEAGQCIEPLAWCIFPLADKYVLAGDPWQLPPTVLSFEAAQKGLTRSILEVSMSLTPRVFLLNTQYRMRQSLAGFSGSYFYEGRLLSAAHLQNLHNAHLTFIDTAGSGFNETSGSSGFSLQNEGELQIVLKIMASENLQVQDTAFISPYAGQVAAAKELLPAAMRLSTIDSFQGQEKETIVLSLVRSNEDGDIGFLKDYRRMNVAITRAKEKLFVIGDSATIGGDPFYHAFLTYIEEHGSYRSVWELEM